MTKSITAIALNAISVQCCLPIFLGQTLQNVLFRIIMFNINCKAFPSKIKIILCTTSHTKENNVQCYPRGIEAL